MKPMLKEILTDYIAHLDFAELIDLVCAVVFPIVYTSITKNSFPQAQWTSFIVSFPIGYTLCLLIAMFLMESETLYAFKLLHRLVPSAQTDGPTVYVEAEKASAELDVTIENPTASEH